MTKSTTLAFGVCVTLLLHTSGSCWAGDTAAFIAKVGDTPAWASLSDKQLKQHAAKIEELGKEFQGFTPDQARDVVTTLQERAYKRRVAGEPTDSLSTIYVLLRFYYAVPEYEQRDKVKFFGGWRGIKERDEQYNILFPLHEDSDGNLRISGSFQGYMGSDYNAVREMEHLNRTYGRRVTSKP